MGTMSRAFRWKSDLIRIRVFAASAPSVCIISIICGLRVNIYIHLQSPTSFSSSYPIKQPITQRQQQQLFLPNKKDLLSHQYTQTTTMRFPILLALASRLLTYALHINTNTSLNIINARPEWTPNLPYPTGYSPATCPLRPGPNSFCPLQVQGWKKRSVTTTTHLRRRTEVCRLIKQCIINNRLIFYGLTKEVLLTKGAIYVFSWTLNAVALIDAYRRNPDGTLTFIQSDDSHTEMGTITLNIDQTAPVQFRISFSGAPWSVSGEIALFQIGPG